MFSRNLRLQWRVAADRSDGRDFTIASQAILLKTQPQIPSSCTHGIGVCL